MEPLAHASTALASRHRRGVSVRLGSAVPAEARRESALCCVVGIAPESFPWLADLYPAALVRGTRFRDQGCAVEHIRLRSRDGVDGLPGLEGPARSRVRDAVRLVLSVGAPFVDVVLARANGAMPWDFERADVHEAFDPVLAELTGAAMVYPDLGGPIAVGPGTEVPLADRLPAVLDLVRRSAQAWRERYQIGLIDDCGAEGEEELHLLRSLLGTDAALCRWTGPREALAVHGWRSGAAVVGGMLSGDGADVGRGLVSRSVQLAPGRQVPRGRASELDLSPRIEPVDDRSSAYLCLRLHAREDRVTVTSEPTFRPPVGAWPLPALRVVKNIHRQIVEAAERFVFQTVDDAQAIALAVGLQRAVRAYSGRGLLVGPDGEGAPDIRGGVHRSAEQPGLYAVVAAQLRPWSQTISVRVSLRPGGAPVLEVP